MSAHTPGPWTADAHFAQREGGRTYIPVLRSGNDPVPLAVVHRDVDGYGKGEGEANARLIAAAPDLLAACVSALDDANHGDPSDGRTINLLTAAIAKATGGAS